jgi:hypothetical protein
MKHLVSLPVDLVAEVERSAAASSRPVDLEYGRLFALGLLAKLAEELSPLFPELGQPALPPQKNDAAKVTPRSIPDVKTRKPVTCSVPDAGRPVTPAAFGEPCDVTG